MWTFNRIRAPEGQGFSPAAPTRSLEPLANVGTPFAAGLKPHASRLKPRPSQAWPNAFCHALLDPVLFLLLLFLSPALAATGLYEVREIKPHVFVWVPDDVVDQEGDPDFARSGTAGFIIAADAVVVVDTTNSPFHARELLYEIRQRTEAPVRYVIDTDSEGDQTLGNEVFVDQQATIISTPSTQAEMRRYQSELPRRLQGDWRLQTRMRGFHPILPSQTFEGDTVLRLDRREPNGAASSTGNTSHSGPAQPTGNAADQTNAPEIKLLTLRTRPSTAVGAVYLPAAKILFLGDLFHHRYFPRIGARPLVRWIELLRQVEALDAEIYVPGHGAPGSKGDVAQFRQFLEWLSAAVEARVKQGKSLDQTKAELAGPLENYRWHAPELGVEAVEDAYHQLAASAGRPSATASGARAAEPVAVQR